MSFFAHKFLRAERRASRHWNVLSVLLAGTFAGCTLSPEMDSLITITGPQIQVEYENNPLRQMSKQQWYARGFGLLEVVTNDGGELSLAAADHDAATDVITFVAEDRRQLLTFNGRVVASFGFSGDIAELSTLGPNPFKRGNFDDFTARPVQWLLIERSHERPLRAFSRYQISRPSEIPFAEGTQQVRQIAEDWWIPELGWRETNYYWINAQGVVLLSEQSLHPRFPRVHTTFRSRALAPKTPTE